jgi:phage recombination protein Bet
MSQNLPTTIKSPRQELAELQGMEQAKYMTMLKTVMPAATSEAQIDAFLSVARQYQLNPLTKEIYAFPSKGGIQPLVSVDGWIKLANRNPNYDGITFIDNVQDGKLFSITAQVRRKDHSKPTEVTEYMEECRRQTDPWNKSPCRMLRHKATIQGFRLAFGFSGIMDEDEFERIEQPERKIVTPAEDTILDAPVHPDKKIERQDVLDFVMGTFQCTREQAAPKIKAAMNSKTFADLTEDEKALLLLPETYDAVPIELASPDPA